MQGYAATSINKSTLLQSTYTTNMHPGMIVHSLCVSMCMCVCVRAHFRVCSLNKLPHGPVNQIRVYAQYVIRFPQLVHKSVIIYCAAHVSITSCKLVYRNRPKQSEGYSSLDTAPALYVAADYNKEALSDCPLYALIRDRSCRKCCLNASQIWQGSAGVLVCNYSTCFFCNRVRPSELAVK